MFNRRRFLAGLLAGPAAAIAIEGPKPGTANGQSIWVIVGTNWEHNDEVNYPAGDFLTEHVYTDKALADELCSDFIRQFRDSDDPDEFIGSDVSEPDGWHDWSKDQKWDWLFGLTENPSGSDPEWAGGFGWVNLPFEVREMRLPASAVAQRALAARRSKEDFL
jgi:hypothetical protein